MEKALINWIKGSDYDIASAETMFRGKRYVYVIFFCHLSVEKLLKAIVCKATNKVPPKTHDLFLLLELAGLEPPKSGQLLIAHLNSASIPTRYPQDFSKISRQYNLSAAKRYLNDTRGLLKWLKQVPILRK